MSKCGVQLESTGERCQLDAGHTDYHRGEGGPFGPWVDPQASRSTGERAMSDLVERLRADAHHPGVAPATALQAADAIERVLEMHHPMNDLGSPPCSHCLGDEDGESVFVLWPCPTVRAITGQQPADKDPR